MNDKDKLFQELLEDLGLAESQKYFQTPEELARMFEFGGERASEFAKYFQPYDTSGALEAFKTIGQQQALQTGELMGGLSSELGQATRQIRERGTGFGRFGRSMQDIIAASQTAAGQLGAGLSQIRETAGRGRTALIGNIQDYVSSILQQRRRIEGLDIVDSQDSVDIIPPQIQEIMDANPGMTRAEAEDMYNAQFYQQGLDQVNQFT